MKKIGLILFVCLSLLSGCRMAEKEPYWEADNPDSPNPSMKATTALATSSSTTRPTATPTTTPTMTPTATPTTTTTPLVISQQERVSFLAEMISSCTELNSSMLSIPKVTAGVKVVEMHWRKEVGGEKLPEELLPSRQIETFFTVTDALVQFNETELFPDSADEYVYVVFRLTANDLGPELMGCTNVVLENNTLTMDFVVEVNQAADSALLESLVIVKIEKASLQSEVKDIKLNFSCSVI